MNRKCIRKLMLLQTIQNDSITFTSMKNKKVKIQRWIQAEDTKKQIVYKKNYKTVRAISRKKETAHSTVGNVVILDIPETSDFLNFSNESIADDINNLIGILEGGTLAYNILDNFVSILVEECNSNKSGILTKRSANVTLDSIPCYFLPLQHGSNVSSIISPDFYESPNTDLKNSIVFAPLICSRHYFLVVYDFPEKRISIFDSALYYNSQDLRFHHALNLWKVLIARMVFESPIELEKMMDGWKCIFETDCAQQEDSVSCGYFVIYYIQNLLNGTPEKCSQPLSTLELRKIQEKIVKRTLSTSDIEKKFLYAISM